MDIYCDYYLIEKDLDEVTYNEHAKKVTRDDCKLVQGTTVKELNTFEVTMPTHVVENLDFIVTELQKEDDSVNRNVVLSNLIQNSFVGNIRDGLKKFGNTNHEESMNMLQEILAQNESK